MPVKVKLIAHTPNPEKIVAMAAKLCYSTCTIDELNDKMDDDAVLRFLEMLADLGHGSPWEHASFTFAIEGVSRSFLAQISRHRIASFSVQSQRYCNLNNTFSYITPQAISDDGESNQLFEQAMDQAYRVYVDLTKRLTDQYIREGMKAKQAEKKAIEDARAVLPNACETKMIVTMNARELLHLFELRCCSRAQQEIREVACEMMRQCKEIAPLLFKNAGPACIAGKCPEGKMSCGKPWR